MDRTRAVLMILAAGLLLLAVLLVLPFVEFFLLAVLLAYPLRPLQRRLEPRFGPKLTAGLLVLGATVAIIVPVLWLLRIVVREATNFLDRVRDGEIDFAELEAWILDTTGEEVDLLDTAQQTIQQSQFSTVDGALGVFQTLTSLLIGVALTMFLLYYFLKDADRFNRWLRATVPLRDEVYDQLRSEFDDVMWAVLVSHVLIAVIQGFVAGLGLIVLGVPNAVFWTAVMILLAVLPIVGSFLIWGPAAFYLFSIGQPLAGVALFIYGLIVVSLSDDFLRPITIDRYTETRLNPSAIVVGILGGVYLIGFIGIFFGPVIIGSLRSVLDVYRREYVQTEPTPAQSTTDPVAEDIEQSDPSTADTAQSDPSTSDTAQPDPSTADTTQQGPDAGHTPSGE
jgi:predicted PurR-regulated permease PerM